MACTACDDVWENKLIVMIDDEPYCRDCAEAMNEPREDIDEEAE
jgi:hypothetical protein